MLFPAIYRRCTIASPREHVQSIQSIAAVYAGAAVLFGRGHADGWSGRPEHCRGGDADGDASTSPMLRICSILTATGNGGTAAGYVGAVQQPANHVE